MSINTGGETTISVRVPWDTVNDYIDGIWVSGSFDGPGWIYLTIPNPMWQQFDTPLSALGNAVATGGQIASPQTPAPPQHIGTPKTNSQCSIYLQGGTTSGDLLNIICQNTPNGPTFNQMRGCLQTLYSPTSGYLPLPLFILLPGGSFFNLNSIIPGAGAHATCAADAIQ